MRNADHYPWLAGFLTADRLAKLLPEADGLRIERFEFPNLGSLNFVLHRFLDEGVAASTRTDPQAKALGEWLRARIVPVPSEFLHSGRDSPP